MPGIQADAARHGIGPASYPAQGNNQALNQGSGHGVGPLGVPVALATLTNCVASLWWSALPGTCFDGECRAESGRE